MGLLDAEDDYIQLSFTMNQVPTKPTPRPQRIDLPHSFHNETQNSRVCLFVKDPARDFKDQIMDMNVPTLAKVIGYDKLKREFKQFKDKRSLLKDYDAFLADLRIYKMLPELLGKGFYQNKKYPCPIKIHNFEGDALKDQINSACEATTFMMGNGPNYSIKVGKTF